MKSSTPEHLSDKVWGKEKTGESGAGKSEPTERLRDGEIDGM